MSVQSDLLQIIRNWNSFSLTHRTNRNRLFGLRARLECLKRLEFYNTNHTHAAAPSQCLVEWPSRSWFAYEIILSRIVKTPTKLTKLENQFRMNRSDFPPIIDWANDFKSTGETGIYDDGPHDKLTKDKGRMVSKQLILIATVQQWQYRIRIRPDELHNAILCPLDEHSLKLLSNWSKATSEPHNFCLPQPIKRCHTPHYIAASRAKFLSQNRIENMISFLSCTDCTNRKSMESSGNNHTLSVLNVFLVPIGRCNYLTIIGDIT